MILLGILGLLATVIVFGLKYLFIAFMALLIILQVMRFFYDRRNKEKTEGDL